MMDEDELPEGEMVELDEDEQSDVTDTDDGGALVTLDEEGPKAGDSEFYANLAADMPEPELNRIATGFVELITRDAEARAKRDKQYEEGLRRTGLGDDAPGGAQFEGASKVVHPMLTEACVDFAARTIKELWPASGPVKTEIIGEETASKTEKAERKAETMNWQLTVQAKEARAELEQLLTQVPLGGAQYLKITWDEQRNKPTFLFVAIDDMYLPFAATNFYSAQRRTHRQFLTQLDFESRVKSGMYRDVTLAPVGMEPEVSASGKASDKIEGRESTSYNEDGLRTVFEVYALTEVDEDEGIAPYIITIDKATDKVLSIYRNWAEDDDSKTELEWIVEFPFIPWRGAYPIGLPHMIGGLSAAATGALRALLDSAHIQNTPAGLKIKSQVGGQTKTPLPGEIVEVDGGLQVDDIRKLFMPMPYNAPSAVLFQLLGFVVEAGKGVVRTTLEDVGDTNPNTPVGTTMARMEQAMVVYSAIHGRLHDAMGRVMRILHRHDAMYLDDEMLEREAGEGMATRKDFNGPMDIVPVSDPNIYSETQRFAQVQAIVQRSAAVPGLYNLRKVEKRLLETLKVPNAEELLAPAAEPKEQNAISENVAMTLGRTVLAFPRQDHLAHIQTHLTYMTSPLLGANPIIAPGFLPGVLQHLKEHITLWYAQRVSDIAEEVTGVDVGREMKGNKTSKEKQAFDRLLAEASVQAAAEAAQLLQAVLPVIQQAQQMLQQLAPQQPMDPAQAAAQAVQMEAQSRAQTAQMQMQARMQEAQMRLQAQQATEQARLQLAAADQQRDAQLEAADMQARVAMNDADNQTAILLQQMRDAADAQQAGSAPLNPNPGF